MKSDICYCCGATTKEIHASARVMVSRCEGCGSLLTDFPQTATGDNPWDMGNVTPVFLEALRYRRAVQASAIQSAFSGYLSKGTVLDYGCGQGAFVKFLLSKGLKAKGCDISDSNVDTSALGSNFISLSQPWEIPDLSGFSLISFLDVIEHAEEPGEIVNRLKQAKIQYVMIKVPMLFGPIGAFSQLLASRGNAGLLERLLLVGDISPHYSFFSSKGMRLLFETRGFALRSSKRIADVGKELPERLRGKDGEPEVPAKRLIGKTAGTGLAVLAPLWSDTRVFLFENTGR